MTQETKYRTCQCESAQKVERQVLVIRGLRKRHKVLTQANISASHQIRRLVAENESLKKQLEEIK